MPAVELSVGKTYIYRGQIFKSDVIYDVSEEVARDLLTKQTDRGLHHFRMTMLPDDVEAEKPEQVEGDVAAKPNIPRDEVKVAAVREKAPAQDDEVKKTITIRRGKKRTAEV